MTRLRIRVPRMVFAAALTFLATVALATTGGDAVGKPKKNPKDMAQQPAKDLPKDISAPAATDGTSGTCAKNLDSCRNSCNTEVSVCMGRCCPKGEKCTAPKLNKCMADCNTKLPTCEKQRKCTPC
jgi:hypothetical protein